MLFRTLITAFALLITTYAHAGNVASVTSSQGWTITIAIRYTGITLLSQNNNCRYGFNYVQNYDYEVSYSGTTGPRTYYIGIGGGCATDGGTIGIPENSSLSGSIQSYNKYSNTNKQCNKIDPADYACETMNLTISGPGIPEQTVSMQYMDESAVLPVSFGSVRADQTTEGIRVQWDTYESREHAYFIIERSSDAIRWEPLASVNGATQSSPFSSYHYTDSDPLHRTAYYRIVQVDMDGSQELSQVMTVNVESPEVSVYPNPVSTNLTLRGFSDIRIFDMRGQDVTSRLPISRDGEGTYRVNVSGLANGLYVIKSPTDTRYVQRL